MAFESAKESNKQHRKKQFEYKKKKERQEADRGLSCYYENIANQNLDNVQKK